MKPIDRRSFLKNSLLGAAVVPFADPPPLAAQTAARGIAVGPLSKAPGIIDTNVNLFDWPFRALKYRDTKALVAKLKRHRVMEAWAGSFEALFSKDMSGVNTRLAAECREHGPRFLIPFGSVNLAWPDWEEDLRRCHELHSMRGIRIYPGYQPFDLEHPSMESLVKMTAERGLILQVVFGMEDPRVHHPILKVGSVTVGPLLKLLKTMPKAKAQLLHFSGLRQPETGGGSAQRADSGPAPANSSREDELSQFLANPNTVLDISRLEGNGAVGRMIGSGPGPQSTPLPLDRIVFGSHAPYFPVETAILKLIESPLDAQQLHAIMQGNAQRLLPNWNSSFGNRK